MTKPVRNLTEEQTAEILERFYRKYHKAEYINPDPLIFPLRYTDFKDIEASAFISAAFALGRVNAILDFLEKLFLRLGSPYDGLVNRSEAELTALAAGMKYRFYSESDIGKFLAGLRRIYIEYGSLENCFSAGVEKTPDTGLVPAGLGNIYKSIYSRPGKLVSGCSESAGERPEGRSVIANPDCGSACKRQSLFLRWMVRSDNIDPGGWKLDKSQLIIPVDTHVMKVSTFLGLTNRKSADFTTAVEITDSLKKFDKGDPVRYDFSMSRIGIHPDLTYKELEDQLI